MKTLVVLCALVACCAGSAGWGWNTLATAPGYWAGRSIATSGLVASPYNYLSAAPGLLATRTIAAPGLVASSYAAPLAVAAPVVAAAPAVVATRTVAHAPVAVAHAPVAVAHAPVVAAAPAVVATRTVAAPIVAAPAPVVAHAVAPAAPSITKYHSQDEHGQASYGHSEPLQTHNAVQDAHGNKVGSFSYVNPHDGQVHRTDYVADAHGYRVAANDLPVDTHDVAIAKAAHASAHILARARRSALLASPYLAAPVASSYIAAPVASSYLAAPIATPLAAGWLGDASVVRPAIRTTIVNNPGHAVSYRVD